MASISPVARYRQAFFAVVSQSALQLMHVIRITHLTRVGFIVLTLRHIEAARRRDIILEDSEEEKGIDLRRDKPPLAIRRQVASGRRSGSRCAHD